MYQMSVNVDWKKLHFIQIKNGIMMNVSVIVKNWMIGVLLKMVIRGILVHVVTSVKRHVKLMNI